MATQNQKAKVLNQFNELKQTLISKDKALISELDVIIDTIIDLANRYAPNLSSIIDSLKSLEKEKSFWPDVVALSEKRKMTILYLNQIIKHIENNPLVDSDGKEMPGNKKGIFQMSEGWKIFWAGAILTIIIYLLSRQ